MYNSDAKFPWDDMWIECFIGKRRKIRLAPCFVAREEMEYDFRNNPDGLINIKKELKKEGFAYVGSKNMSNIYVSSEHIDKYTVERATEWYLKKKGILKSEASFRWDNYKEGLKKNEKVENFTY